VEDTTVDRRTFLGSALPFAFAGIALAQAKKKDDRLSGLVTNVDTDKMTIEMHMRNNASAIRKIMYDGATTFTLDGKPAKSSDAKPGNGIVALGKFEGVNLKATKIALTLK
jgi:hypothetical protein